jgi:hypothetical protein
VVVSTRRRTELLQALQLSLGLSKVCRKRVTALYSTNAAI